MPDNPNFLSFYVCSVCRACMDVCECVPACVHVWVRRQQILQLLTSPLFKAASLPTQGTYCFRDTSWPACSRDLQDSAPTVRLQARKSTPRSTPRSAQCSGCYEIWSLRPQSKGSYTTSQVFSSMVLLLVSSSLIKSFTR